MLKGVGGEIFRFSSLHCFLLIAPNPPDRGTKSTEMKWEDNFTPNSPTSSTMTTDMGERSISGRGMHDPREEASKAMFMENGTGSSAVSKQRSRGRRATSGPNSSTQPTPPVCVDRGKKFPCRLEHLAPQLLSDAFLILFLFANTVAFQFFGFNWFFVFLVSETS